MKRILGLLIALAMVSAACGSGSTASDSEDDSGGEVAGGEGDCVAADSSKETISLVVNPWSSSRLNAEVAKALIECQFGNSVEVTETDENDAMFTGMADGTLDAALEIWPSGVTDAEEAFFDAGTVERIGDLGAVGKIGWFVPSYVVADNPDLATWEGFKDPANAALFATAETGDRGRFLGTDPSYAQFDEQIIENLDLPFDVQFSGSETATVAELDSRVAAKEPVVMYWWTPTAAVAKYDLVNVELPAFTDECGASQAAGDGGVDCDYPEDVLFKAASAKLREKDPAVAAFLEKFTLTNDDQYEMLPSFEIDGDEPADVAEAWIAAHEADWKAWL